LILPNLNTEVIPTNDTCYEYTDDVGTWLVKSAEEEDLGSGTYGQVTQACFDNVCKYVAKEQVFFELDDRLRYRKRFYWNRFIGEALITKFAYEKGFGVPFYGYFICDNGRKGMMFMDRYTDTLRKANLSRDDVNQLIKRIEQMHNAGILHQDLFAKNVMYKRLPDGSKDIKIIDFGLSVAFRKKVPLMLRAVDYITMAQSLHRQKDAQRMLIEASIKNNGFEAHEQAQKWITQRKTTCGAEYKLLEVLPEYIYQFYGPAVADLLAWSTRCSKDHSRAVSRMIVKELRKRDLPLK
jgi:tRNA A-37 threonylcarbamoyl transferase component Bud32